MRVAWILMAAVVTGCAPQTPPGAGSEPKSARTGLRFLQDDGENGFARALTPRQFQFPEDHGSHAEFRSEWWYLTGNVASAKGERFGFQATFFRFGLSAAEANRGGSNWRASQAWMAHIAVVAKARGQFVARERLARDALGIAGEGAIVGSVRVEDWELRATHLGERVEWSINAQDDDVGLALVAVGESTGAIPQGEGGLDRKGPEAGNASFYYSMPRLKVTGALRIDGRETEVAGNAWLDREWGTSALSQDVEGWDWFALQLDDGNSLMYYRLRRRDGTANEFSGGSWMGVDGTVVRLHSGDATLRPLVWWRSPATLTRYPIEWDVEIPSRRVALRVRAVVPQQELNLTVRYWEGAVDVSGTHENRGIRGQGYVELTGYAQAL